MKRLLQLLLCLTLLTGASAWAVCAASCTNCVAPTNSQADLSTCVSNAATGATITVPAGAGTVTWSSPPILPATKGLSIIGPGYANLTVTLGGTWEAQLSTGRIHRISGFTFGGSPEPLLWIGNTGRFQIDNNRFQNFTAGEWLTVSAIQDLAGPIYGLVNNNIINASSNRRVLLNTHNIDYGTRGNWASGSRLGSPDNIYFEDNTFTFTTQDDVGLGLIDSNSGAAWVFRFNIVTNGSVKSHGLCGSEGTANQSIYSNSFTSNSGVTDGYRTIHQQGSGEAVYFNNTFTATGGKSSGTIEVLHYRSATAASSGCVLYPRCDGNAANAGFDGNRTPTGTYYGYPCRYQPGRRDGNILSPQYVWNNKWSDTGAQTVLNITDAWGSSNPSVLTHVQKNRDIYEGGVVAQTSADNCGASCSPFTGSTGMGFGRKLQRPTTCTPTNQAADAGNGGVGYWATDEGYWNSKTPGVPSGVLYRCSATNTWTLHYVPYPYPHPLRSGLAAPTGLTVK